MVFSKVKLDPISALSQGVAETFARDCMLFGGTFYAAVERAHKCRRRSSSVSTSAVRTCRPPPPCALLHYVTRDWAHVRRPIHYARCVAHRR